MFSFAKKLVDRFEGHQDQNVDSYFKNTLQINNRGYGLRVLKVDPHSKGHEKGLESWFDYVVRINHHELPMVYPAVSNFAYNINEDGTINYGENATQEHASMIDYNILHQELLNIVNNENSTKELVLDVWSAKGGVIRQVVLPLDKPQQDQSHGQDSINQELSINQQPSVNQLFLNHFQKLGITLRCQHLNTATYVWRILNTHPESPAFQAQLVPYSDYIIGCDSAFPDDVNGKGLLCQGGESFLSTTVLRYYNHNFNKTNQDSVPITLYVYNHDYDVLRPVTVNLTRSWGNGQNKGVLGCDVGYGLLHRIPEVIGKFENDQLVDDLLFDNQKDMSYQFSQSPTPDGNVQASTPAPVSAPVPPPLGNSFTPMAASIAPPPPPPTGGRKKKHHAKGNAADLNDYMNEELQKSKDADSLGKPKPSSDTNLPPPPSKSS